MCLNRHMMLLMQDLREQMDALQRKVQKLKRAVKVYAKRLKANEGDYAASYTTLYLSF